MKTQYTNILKFFFRALGHNFNTFFSLSALFQGVGKVFEEINEELLFHFVSPLPDWFLLDHADHETAATHLQHNLGHATPGQAQWVQSLLHSPSPSSLIASTQSSYGKNLHFYFKKSFKTKVLFFFMVFLCSYRKSK
jgi:hypothetical protein